MSATITERDLIGLFRTMVAEVGQSELARRLGVSRSAVSQIMLGRAVLGAKVAKALGYQRVLMYRRVK